MIHLTEDVRCEALAGFDQVIDVRSPGEFALDHAPGAVNLPVLNDAERAEVGTIYVQDSPFRAARLGAAYVARNIAGHLEGALAEAPRSLRPLVYCWRGGQRSNAMATVLSQVGWRTTVLRGGYRTWRRHVREALYEEAGAALRLILLDGGTGVGKTAMLPRLARRGLQTLDLEGLAEHRGSLLGALPGRPQPSQKMFETRLATALEALDTARPIVVEAEASRIGALMLPPRLLVAMAGAPRLVLQAPLRERAVFLAGLYADLVADARALDQAFVGLSRRHGRAAVEQWRDLAAQAAWADLAEALIETHYDPAYARAAAKGPPPVGVVEAAGLSDLDQEATADRLLKAIGSLSADWAASVGLRLP